MSEKTEELGLAVMIGITIALVFKTLDYFSRLFSQLIVDLWTEAPEFAVELVSFIIVLIFFIIILLIYIIRGRK